MNKEERKKTIMEGAIYLAAVGIIAVALILSVRILQKQEDMEETVDPEETVVYTASVESPSPYGGNLTVNVVCSLEGEILSVEVGENNATEGIGTRAIEELPDAIVAAGGTEVDYVSGASITSQAIIDAVNQALSQRQEQ